MFATLRETLCVWMYVRKRIDIVCSAAMMWGCFGVFELILSVGIFYAES